MELSLYTLHELMNLDQFFELAYKEDVGSGDHSSLACIPQDKKVKAQLVAKASGIIAGLNLTMALWNKFDDTLDINYYFSDGDGIKEGDVLGVISGNAQEILKAERLILNVMQRMSGIATYTNKLANQIKHTSCKLLDTRKTTPLLRFMEKEAVKIGGGSNHRFGLYDMVMLKDNHIDYAGGIALAIERTNAYLKSEKLDLEIEIEVRDREELEEVLAIGGVQRIMLDNFTPKQIKEVLPLIDRTLYKIEASGGINERTLVEYAETGVDYVSMGALTHSYKSLDISLVEMT